MDLIREEKAQFISNNYKEGIKVLSTIEQELLNCDEFFISVAFITMGGITPLLQTLKVLEERNIKGRIITTDYLMFSEPKAIYKLSKFSNIEVKMYLSNDNSDGFHTKGYIFRKGDNYNVIVGSSNMTMNALTKNKEWNTRYSSTRNEKYVTDILDEFNNLWVSENSVDFEEYADIYYKNYEHYRLNKMITIGEEPKLSEYKKLEPNSMQKAFIKGLKNIVDRKQNKALLISATGTGKTYAAAFAMRELKFKRVLFLVHRNRIAKQARKSFSKVINGISVGEVTGDSKDVNSDYIFATIQTFSKDDVLYSYDKKAFDAIIIDEAHHSSASSYKKVLDYFEPSLWLGMTATPDKKDDNIDGRNIYEIFNHEIAYEIRLQDAMDEDLLCPFHYFGITDISLSHEDKLTNTLVKKVSNFKLLTSDERVEHVIREAKYFGYSGDRVKGLMFCSRIDEANELSRKFNEKGLRTIVLSGADSEEKRNNAIERLVGPESENALDYILSVDIFSEGVDVPEINQVIMLRPTESPIVFIQQLGRGLRKFEGKEYVVVLDFIGNYTNNFMIPIALSGDRSYNKDNVRRYIIEGEKAIPGSSTIHFDEISKKKIYEAIDQANFSDSKLLKENYANLKNKLGRIPALMDFDKYGEMDVLRIFDNNNYGSYYKFLVKVDDEYKIRLSEDEEKVIEFISKKFADGKRVHELEMLNIMLNNRDGIIDKTRKILLKKYNIDIDLNCRNNLVNIMTNEFPSGAAKKTYEQCVFIEKEYDDYKVSDEFLKMLNNDDFFNVLNELIEFGINRYAKNYSKRYFDTNLVLYEKYTYEDVCRLLNWEKNEVPLNIGGYKYDKVTKTFPVFINYHKSSDIVATIKYEDHFVNRKTLIAISKSGRSIESDDVQKFVNAKERGIVVHLFVRKNKDDKISKEFYYMGTMTATGNTKEFIMDGTTKTAVEIEWKLDTPVKEDLYDYIVNN